MPILNCITFRLLVCVSSRYMVLRVAQIWRTLALRMLPFEDDNGGKLSYTLNGTLYPDEQVVIYDIGDVKPETEKKRRGRRKKSEIEAEQKEN